MSHTLLSEDPDLATFLLRFKAMSAATFTKIIYTIEHMYIYYAPTNLI